MTNSKMKKKTEMLAQQAAFAIGFALLLTVQFSFAAAGANYAPLPTPTPKKPAAAATPKKPGPPVTPPAAQQTQKIIVSTTAARVRSGSTTASTEVKRMKLGTVLTVLEKTSGSNFWYKVQLPTNSKPSTGWMSSTVANNFEPGKAENLYRQITSRNYKDDRMSFTDAVELYEFLTRVVPEIKSAEIAAELGLKRLQVLTLALNDIPMEKLENAPYKKFTTAQDKNIVYSDPSGQFYVRAELYWNLHKKYVGTAIGEEIAWAASRVTLPGECEGYVVCNLYAISETDGRYLSHYPDGKNSGEALMSIIGSLEMIANPEAKSLNEGPSDLSDRAEFNKYLNDLRQTISKLPHVDKDKALRYITKIAEMYR